LFRKGQQSGFEGPEVVDNLCASFISHERGYMKSSELKVGMEVRFDDEVDHGYRLGIRKEPVRGKVLQVKIKTPDSERANKVKVLIETGTRKGREVIIPSRRIKTPWSEYADIWEAKQRKELAEAVKSEMKLQAEAEKKERMNELCEKLQMLGMGHAKVAAAYWTEEEFNDQGLKRNVPKNGIAIQIVYPDMDVLELLINTYLHTTLGGMIDGD
jgi:hypothetical protein